VNQTFDMRSFARGWYAAAVLVAASLWAAPAFAQQADGGKAVVGDAVVDKASAGPPAASAAATPAPAAAGAGDTRMRSLVIADEPLPTPVMRLGEPETVVPPRLVDDVSAGAVDGMLLQEYGLEEMPEEASSGQWFSSGMRYGSAELLMMDRSRNYRRVMGFDPLVTPAPFAPNSRLNFAGTFVTTGVPFNLAPAGRITVGEYLGRDDLDRDRSVELTYYGGLSYFLDDSFSSVKGSYLVTPLAGPTGIGSALQRGLAGFTGATTYRSTNGSNFNSLELNYKLHRRLGRDQLVMSPNGGWARHAERGWLPAIFLGTRLANIDESFTFAASRNDQPADVFSGNYAIATQNWLWGVNLGGELISRSEFFYWGLRGRATPCISFAGNQQYGSGVNTMPQTVPPDVFARGTYVLPRQSANQVGGGFLGDMTFLAGYNLTPNFSLQFGYDLLWAAGVATATRQFNLDNIRPNSIDAGGQIFYMGFSGGIQGSW